MNPSGGAAGVERLRRGQTRAAIVGVLGFVALAAGGFGNPDQFLPVLPAGVRLRVRESRSGRSRS